MRKLLHTFIGLLAFSSLGFSQSSFSISGASPSYYITNEIQINPAVEQDVEFHATVTNTSQNTIHTRIYREYLTQGTNHQNYICWGPGCYAHFLDTSSIADTVMMAPGESNTTFFGHVKPLEQVGITTVKYCVYDQNNITDSTCFIVVYDFTPVGIEDAFTSKITMGDPYPNPANDQIQLGYDITGTDNRSNVMVYNAIGEVVHSEQIVGTQGIYTLKTENLPQGLYYISLQSNNSALTTKKFTVTR